MATITTNITYGFVVTSREFGLIIKGLQQLGPKGMEIAKDLGERREHARHEIARAFIVNAETKEKDL